jgi:hypothetical protein
MIQIQPYTTTDAQIIAVRLDIKMVNPTDVSIDAFWTLYDAASNKVDEGSFQLAEDDFIAWQADNAYAQEYVMNQKGIYTVS